MIMICKQNTTKNKLSEFQEKIEGIVLIRSTTYYLGCGRFLSEVVVVF